MAGNQKHWLTLCRVLEVPALAEDPRFITNTDRVKNKAELHALLDNILKTRTRTEWGHRLLDADLPFAPVNRIDEIVGDPQVLSRDMVQELDHPKHGRMNFTGFPAKLSETPLEFRQFPPEVGQHTDEVLGALGYSRDDIATFRKAGTV
jgi:crotonobetainyl-CoA:carnitine CoA-transferase CaiB-like acyl-CoA transferase